MPPKSQSPQTIPKNRARTSCADKNDKLGWTDGFSIEYEGLDIGFRTNQAAVLPRLRDLVPMPSRPSKAVEVDVLFSLWVGAPSKSKGVRNYTVAYEAWGRVARSLSLDEALQSLENYARIQYAGLARERTFFQAALVSWKGQGVLISEGVSTARANLLDSLTSAGMTVHATDFVGVNDDGALWSLDLSDPIKVEPKLFLHTVFRDKGSWRPKTLGPLENTMNLIGSARGLNLNPGPALKRLAEISKRTASYSGSYRNPTRLANFILQTLKTNGRHR